MLLSYHLFCILGDQGERGHGAAQSGMLLKEGLETSKSWPLIGRLHHARLSRPFAAHDIAYHV